MVGRGEDLLNPEGAQVHGPNGANELSSAIREESSGGAKVGDDMPHEGLADCACGVITGRDEDGVLGKAIYEDNQELVASIGRERAHDIDGQGIPRPLGTGWCPLSSGSGHNRCPTGTGGNFERSPNRCGSLLYGSTGHGKASIKSGHRGG